MATKTVDVCDDCDNANLWIRKVCVDTQTEESEEMKKCTQCGKIFCLDCQSEHIENDHFDFDDYYDEHKDEFWKDV